VETPKERRPNQQNRKIGRTCSGVFTTYLGEPDSPIMQGLEAFCILHKMTVSEAGRYMITSFLSGKHPTINPKQEVVSEEQKEPETRPTVLRRVRPTGKSESGRK